MMQVARFKDPQDACAAIVAESHRLWLQNETRTDDITIIIVQINGLHDSGIAQRVNDINVKPVQQEYEATDCCGIMLKFAVQAHIEQALHRNYLFYKLTAAQLHILCECMKRLKVIAGDIIVQQENESGCFYIVGKGEFEALVSQVHCNNVFSGKKAFLLAPFTQMPEPLMPFGHSNWISCYTCTLLLSDVHIE
eukprot:Gb_23112 [translate_table: standard]